LDYHLFYGGVAASCAIISVTSALVWLIISLITKPIRSDIEEIKQCLREIVPKVKSETDLQRMIAVDFSERSKACVRAVESKINEAVLTHERRYHIGDGGK
jgi:hypothetical protein